MVNMAANDLEYRIPITYGKKARENVYEKMRRDPQLRFLVDLILSRESLCDLFKDGKTALPIYYALIGGPIIRSQLENLVSRFIQLEEVPLAGRRFS